MENFKLTEQDRATLQSKVTTKLRDLILKGEFKMGDRLMQEEWAQKLGVSRMPLREALRQLEVEGLVRIEPRRGAIVTPISIEDIEEIYRLRQMLEGEVAVQSLPFLEEEDIKELEYLYEKMLNLKHTESEMELYMQLNKEFHQIIIEASPGRRIKGFIHTLWQGVPQYTPSLLAKHLSDSHEEHRLMVKYIKEKDAVRLREVMEKHINRTKENLIKMINKN
ncbi:MULTISPECIES: GntR family transcriptional regulator [unclassified Psychrobacillus]|uniref:GntR family transcriptional regulator n=1 Tax=unclassified Psychrobacillus TaxID=2636677 RepID=UPI00249907F8|nr:GntR family transcriptional regulator [Psychrobacillus sp. NEAU-3TGS]MDI2587531.1 GntR family transcriptional regulator [Psychrobacillus sp. NEAU-3TGS]